MRTRRCPIASRTLRASAGAVCRETTLTTGYDRPPDAPLRLTLVKLSARVSCMDALEKHYAELRKQPKLTITGLDNHKKPRQDWADMLAALDDRGFIALTERSIWLSAYANSNPGSDYHWQADACYDESQRRGNVGLYKQAYDQARA